MALIVAVFFLPWLHRRLIQQDWQLRWYHVFLGPLVLRRGEVPPAPQGFAIVQDYYRGHKTLEELQAERNTPSDPEHAAKASTENSTENDTEIGKEGHTMATAAEKSGPSSSGPPSIHEPPLFSFIGPRPEGKGTYHPVMLFWQFRRFFFRGVEKDVVSLQKKRNILTGDLEMTHAHAKHYDNRAEYMYSFLQIMTAATASFTHGANDVSKYVARSLLYNSVFPLANQRIPAPSAPTLLSISSGPLTNSNPRVPFPTGSCKYINVHVQITSPQTNHASTVPSVVLPLPSVSGPTDTTSCAT